MSERSERPAGLTAPFAKRARFHGGDIRRACSRWDRFDRLCRGAEPTAPRPSPEISRRELGWQPRHLDPEAEITGLP